MKTSNEYVYLKIGHILLFVLVFLFVCGGLCFIYDRQPESIVIFSVIIISCVVYNIMLRLSLSFREDVIRAKAGSVILTVTDEISSQSIINAVGFCDNGIIIYRDKPKFYAYSKVSYNFTGEMPDIVVFGVYGLGRITISARRLRIAALDSILKHKCS